MKTSCLPVSYFAPVLNGQMSLRTVIEQLRGIGYDSVDLSIMLVPHHNTPAFAELKKILADTDTKLCMLTAYPDFTTPDKIQRRREMDYCRSEIALAAELGVSYYRITPGCAHPETSVEDGIEIAVENFASAAEFAKEYGVKLLYENHSKPGAWAYCDFSHPTDIFRAICKRIRGLGIGVNFDTINTIVYGDDPMPVLKEVADLVETVHIADSYKFGKLEPAVIGTGVAPVKDILAYLKNNVGFDGWLCVEEASGTGENGMRTAYDFTVNTWNSLL